MGDQTIVQLPCYEPAYSIEFSEADLLQHVLVVGGTGCGKTTLLHRFMASCIAAPKVGLLIFDAKQDDTPERVRTLARRAGREAEVCVLGPAGDCCLDLFASLRSLADVDRTTRRLLMGSGSMGQENAFWDESRFALLDAALSLLVLTEGRVRLNRAVALMRDAFFSPAGKRPLLNNALQQVKDLRLRSDAERHKLQQVLDVWSMWQELDQKTRSNIQATLMVALRPILSVPAGQCFDPQGRRAFDVAEVATQGSICVVSLNATVEPTLASLFFRIVKDDFFRAVQQRNPHQNKLCAVIADEWPLLASPGDGEALATVRAKGCSICAGTQSLEEILGGRLRRSMITNFGTLVFMRSREETTDQLACTALGEREVTRWQTLRSSSGPIKRRRHTNTERVCPPGALGRLPTHHAYVVLANGRRIPQAVWFAPWFEAPVVAEGPVDPTHRHSLERLNQLMADAGFTPRTDATRFEALIIRAGSEHDRGEVLRRTQEFFRAKAVIIPHGLETLPTPWLCGLPGILWGLRKPEWTQLPFMLCAVSLAGGSLLLQFAQEQPSIGVTSYDRIRVSVNASLYPSRWRALKPRHEHSPTRAEPRPARIGPELG